MYGAFKEAFSGAWGCLCRYKNTAVSSAIENEMEKLKVAIKKEAKVIYKKEKAKEIKKIITEAVFSEYYIKENEFYKKVARCLEWIRKQRTRLSRRKGHKTIL